MTTSSHKTEGVNRPKTMRFYPYVFTGKEKDEETGYGYFGARYMDHELMTMWLSVDPMSDKYPSISPYAYCAWNPVKLVDPNGKEFNAAMEKHVKKLLEYCDNMIEKLSHLEERTELQNKRLEEIKKAKVEISLLRDDPTTIYCFIEGSFSMGDDGGITQYAGSATNGERMQHIIRVALNTNVSKSPLDDNGDLTDEGIFRLAHELKHCYQFYSNETVYADCKEGVKTYNTPELEEAAYNRGLAFGCTVRWQTANRSGYSFFQGTVEEFISTYSNCEIIKHRGK